VNGHLTENVFPLTQNLTSTLTAGSHFSVVKLSAARIAIQLQLLPPSYSVATLHKALVQMLHWAYNEMKMKLCSTKLKSERA